MKEFNFLEKHKTIFKKYTVEKELGKGSFGKVYLGKAISNGELVALKVEPITKNNSALESEAYTLNNLKGFGIPKILSYGKTKNFRILIETLLGQSLCDIFKKYRRKLSLYDICLIAIQVLERIELVHAHGYIHKDIKPDNFLIGKKDKNVIYIIDFGLSGKYISSKTNKHIKYRNIEKLMGSLRYASVNALRGGEQSRKDDLISIGYMIIYFMKRELPWQTFKAKEKE